MLKNNYCFFQNEYNSYKKILKEYKENSRIFVDKNFHPNYRIKEFNEKINLYNSSVEWKRIDDIYPGPLFQQDLIHQDYIAQGKLGDCYFITALSRIAKQPYLIPPLFEKELPNSILGEVPNSINIKCGAVVVYFEAFGRKTPVLIDTLIPTINRKPIFSSLIDETKSGWFCLVEKAFAKLNGSYSNIESGYYSDSIYSLYGYYNKIILIQKPSKGKSHLEKIINHQKNGCIMDASVNTSLLENVTEEEVSNKKLITSHSYLLLKISKVKSSYYFLLRNPWGEHVWTGNYSENSPLLTNELKTRLGKYDSKSEFWIIENDFFKYFTTINISKPIRSTWHVRYFECSLGQSQKQIPKDVKDMHLENLPNFSFQLTQPIPEGKKARFRILCEKKFGDFIPSTKRINNMITISRSNGRKLSSNVLNESQKCSITIFKTTFYFSFPIKDQDDIFTFVIHYKDPITFPQNFFVRVFCEFDFKLYNNDNPTKIFPEGENPGPVFHNFTPTDPLKALPLIPVSDGYNNIIDISEPNASDFDLSSNDLIDKIIYNKHRNSGMSHYSHCGAQLDLFNFIYNNEKADIGNNYKVFPVTEKETGKKFTALLYRYQLSNITDQFSVELSIRQKLKYPSIIKLFGYSETGFKNEKNPVFITEFCANGSLLQMLQNENETKTENENSNDNENNNDNEINNVNENNEDDDKNKRNNSIKWNNTKKMINLIGIALALRYIHRQNIIHYDLKCSGIFLDENLYPKVGDFGAARFSNVKPEPIKNNRDLYCIAPEMYKGGENCSRPVDIYAYGIIFCHIITNEMPTIPHSSLPDFYIKNINGHFPELEKIPPKFHDFLKSLWNKDPKLRPSFNEIVDLLIKDDTYWLDNVDSNEIKKYISQFEN